MSISTDWSHGYFADDGYSYGFYPEMAPLHVAWAALLRGIALPTQRFTYVDLGCGQGFGLVLLAACHPEAQFVGVDFMPAHIAHARQLAADAGLGNVRFVEGDFMALARDPSSLTVPSGQPLVERADYVVAHGIAAWVAQPVLDAVWSLTSQLLRPGGVHYTSYNVATGWSGMALYQHCVSVLQQRGRAGLAAVNEAMDLFARLRQIDVPLYGEHPSLDRLLTIARGKDPAYLTHEFDNQYWQPKHFADMAAQAARAKLTWLGSSHMPDLFESLQAPALAKLLTAEADPILRETLKDIALQTRFRRDLYVKGKATLWPQDKADRLSQTRFTAVSKEPLPRGDDGRVPIQTDFGVLKGNFADLEKLRSRAAAGGASVEELRQAAGHADIAQTLRSVSLLHHMRELELEQPEFVNAGMFNQAVLEARCSGAPYKVQAAPAVGTGLMVGGLDMVLALAALRSAKGPGGQPDPAEARAQCTQLQRRQAISLQIDGKVVTEGESFEIALTHKLNQFLAQRWPLWQRLGMA